MDENQKAKKTFRFSESMQSNLAAIKERMHCTDTQAVAIALKRTAKETEPENVELYRELVKEMKLHRKYLNELRRNDFIIIDLLNALCMTLNIPASMDHTQKEFVTRPLADAKTNLSGWLHNIATRYNSGDGGTETDTEELEQIMEAEGDAKKAKL